MPDPAASGTQAVDRAALLVSTVVLAPEALASAELAEETGLPRSTTSRLLAALERTELLQRDDSGSYVAGPLFWLYASRHDPWAEIARLARPAMEEIGDATGETVQPRHGPRQPRRPRRPGRLPLPARHPRLDRARRPGALPPPSARCCTPRACCRCPAAARAGHRAHARRPRGPAPRPDRRPRARLGRHRRRARGRPHRSRRTRARRPRRGHRRPRGLRPHPTPRGSARATGALLADAAEQLSDLLGGKAPTRPGTTAKEGVA